MSNNIKVSVIMPFLNSIEYLKECMDSVVNQTLKEIEIICVDAGSDDGTLELLEKYAKKDKRIKIINSDKKSYGYQINLGLNAAKGEYFGIVESDDYIKENMYEVLYNISKKHNCEVVKSDFCAFVHENGERKFTYRPLIYIKELYNKVISPREDLRLFRGNNLNQIGIYSMNLINQNNIKLNETPGASYQDNGLWFQIFSLTNSVYFYDKPFYMLRRDNPNSSVKSKGKVYCMCDEYDYIRKFLKGRPEIEQKLAPICAYNRFLNYEFTLNRISDEFKLEFCNRFSEDFKKIESDCELDWKLFNKKQTDRLKAVMNDPKKYYYNSIVKRNNIEDKKTIKHYVYKCWENYQNNGLKDTVQKVFRHFHFLKKEVKRDYNYYKNLSPNNYPEELKIWYKSQTGKTLNLENPVTFNEKIQWLKLYDNTPLKTQLADKYLVRKWIKEKIGEEYLVPLLGVWDNFDEIDFDNLPEQFVLKANHGSGWNIIVKDKTKFNRESAKQKFEIWLKRNYAFEYGFELQYLNIQPKIIAEKYLEEIDQVYDYKFMCFNGKVEFMWVDSDRFTAHKRTFFNKKWERLEIRQKCDTAKYTITKPYNFEKMLQFAELLSKGFAYVRVDFYEINKKLYFGEMTFTSASGIEFPEPYENVYKWGDLIKLPVKKPIPHNI